MTISLQSESINEIAGALSKMQGSVGLIPKKKTAKIVTKTGGNYSYSYADLADIMSAVKNPMKESGLCIFQVFDGTYLITTVAHSSGQWIKSLFNLKRHEGQKIQEFGSEITYLRRYATCAILGIIADEDDDGQLAQNADPQPTYAYTPPILHEETIGLKQVLEIESLIAGDKEILEKILSGFKIASLTNLPATKFQATMKRIAEMKAA